MIIDVSDPGFCFAFFYVLSFAVPFLLFIFFSKQLKIPLRSVFLLLTTVSLFTIVGSRLATIPVTEWGQLIVTGRFDRYQGRYAIGGLLFGLAGLVISQHILRINKSIINVYAWVAPIGFGLQKIGCFLNGCCYGKHSDLPWSIQYPIRTNAHYNQWITGLIDENATHSLSLHPVQIYEVILLFTIAFIVWKSQKFWKKSWSALIFSLFLFFIFRFSVEFFRDPSSSFFDSGNMAGIRWIQWFLLLMGIVCSIVLFVYENSTRIGYGPPSKGELSVRNSTLYIISVSALIYVFRGLFTPFELLSINIRFVPAVLLTAFYVFRSLKVFRIRVATASFFVLPLFLMTQTLLPDSTRSMSVKDFYGQVKSYKKVDLSTSFGTFYNSLRYNPQEGQCGTTYTDEDYRYSYWMTGAGYSTVKIKGKSISALGINLYGGINKESNLTRQWEHTDFLFGVNPYIKYDLKWVGFGIGAHFGNIRWVPGGPVDKQYVDNGTQFFPVLPEVLLRVGRRDLVDLQYNYGFNLPASIPVLLHEISIGTGFGYRTDYNLRVGTAISENYSTTFISAEALIGKELGLTFKYNFGGDDFYLTNNNPYFIERRGRFLFGANYRFRFKK